MKNNVIKYIFLLFVVALIIFAFYRVYYEDKKSNDTIVKAKIFPNIEAIKDMLKVEMPTKEQIMDVITKCIQKINSKIPNYKHIKGFKIVDKELEKTTTQKIKRYGSNTKLDE